MSPAMLSWPSAPSTASATGASAGPEPSASPSSDVSDVRIMSSTSGRNRPTICSIPGMEHTPPTKSLSTPPRVTTGAVPTRFTSRKWGSVASGWSVYRPSIVMVSASTTMSQSTGAPNTWAVTSTGTCRPDSVTTARTSPWFESRATEKSSMVAGPPVAARACTTHRITRVTHSSRNTVPGGATAAGSKLVRPLTTGPSLAKDRSFTRRPTASGSVAPSGRTSAWSPSPYTTVRRSRSTAPDE